MINIPVPSSSSGPAAVARPAANGATRGKAAGDSAAAADENPFQAVLALELGLTSGPPDPAIAAATEADSSPERGVARAAADALPPPVPADMLPPVLAGALPVPPAQSNASLLSSEYLPGNAGRTIIALESHREPSQKAALAANTELQLPALSAAADFAVPGKFAPAVAGPIRRESAFDSSLLEERQAAPALPTPIHGGGTAVSAPAQAPGIALDARVGAHGWDQALGGKLVWMASQNQQVAQLHLNPPELGPLQITLTLNRDEASAQFVSAHALVRDAIEAAMPRLREMLADSGIALGNASVSSDGFREQAQPQPQPGVHADARAPGAIVADPSAAARGMRTLPLSRGLVDTFA